MTFDQRIDEARRECPNAICLFRVGDFYEAFDDDARSIAKSLGLTITSRQGSGSKRDMAGFPYHQLENYLRRLIALKHRVAICDLTGLKANARSIPTIVRG